MRKVPDWSFLLLIDSPFKAVGEKIKLWMRFLMMLTCNNPRLYSCPRCSLLPKGSILRCKGSLRHTHQPSRTVWWRAFRPGCSCSCDRCDNIGIRGWPASRSRNVARCPRQGCRTLPRRWSAPRLKGQTWKIVLLPIYWQNSEPLARSRSYHALAILYYEIKLVDCLADHKTTWGCPRSGIRYLRTQDLCAKFEFEFFVLLLLPYPRPRKLFPARKWCRKRQQQPSSSLSTSSLTNRLLLQFLIEFAWANK